jgi:hypothetical protein
MWKNLSAAERENIFGWMKSSNPNYSGKSA